MKLTAITPPLIDATLAGGSNNIYACPLEGAPNAAGTTDFRGPNGNVNQFGDGDPVGADKVANHGANEGGNVIRKSGDALTCTSTDSLWTLASTKTTP